MRRIFAGELAVGMRFNKPLFFDDGVNMFLAAGARLSKQHIESLARWNIVYVLTSGVEEKEIRKESPLRSTGKKGRRGEDRAASYLEGKGYSIVERNWHARTGEIDIIARDGSVLVFAEVKTLPNGTAEILARVLGAIKQKRIIETAKQYLSRQREYSDSYVRFDILVIDMPGLPPVWHVENAFAEH